MSSQGEIPMLDKNKQEIDGNNNVQVGRDINVYMSADKKEEKDICIIADILGFIFQNKIKVADIEPTKDEKNKEKKKKYWKKIKKKEKVLRLKEQIQTEFRKLEDQNNDILKIFDELPL